MYAVNGRKRVYDSKRPALVEDVEVFAGFEADGFAGRDGDFGSGAGVAADACFAGLDGEDAKASELDAVALDQGLLHGVEDGVHGGFGLGAYESGAFDDTLDEILFDHAMPRLGLLYEMVG